MRPLTAKDVMTADVLTVGEDWLIDQLAEFLMENSISGAPVVSAEGGLIGVVSVTDIVRFSSIPVAETGSSRVAHEFYTLGGLELAPDELPGFHVDAERTVSVRDIMTPMIFSVNEDTSIKEIADTMIRGRIHRVFVTRGNAIVGVIASLDMLKAMQTMVEEGESGPSAAD